MKKGNGKIDIIIPAYKAHKTILRTLSSIAEQTILSDIEVTIVNDCCPEGDYSEFVNMYSPYFPIKEIKLDKNGGPGVARQAGIDATKNEFFTCIDADDTFNGAVALEILKTGIIEKDSYKVVSGTFLQLGDDLRHVVPHVSDMVWMFGKLYRRSFVEQYKIRFNDTRANEDTGFNMKVKLICDNPMEQIRFIQEAVYLWHSKKDSITRINDGQYAYDQCLCGWTDNMIQSIQHVRKIRPFSGTVLQNIVATMLNLYFYWVETVAKKPIFKDQNWEYVKKFYNTCYKKIEDDITEEVFGQMYSMAAMEKNKSGSMLGVIPCMGIREFMDKLHDEKYDPDDIYKVWAKLKKDKEGKKLIQNNIDCGVCPVGYTDRPEDKESKSEKS